MKDIRDFWKACPPTSIEDIRDDMAMEVILMRQRLLRDADKAIGQLEKRLAQNLLNIREADAIRTHNFFYYHRPKIDHPC